MMGQHLRPARHLDLEGAYNVRELGGYQTSDGRITRWKTFLRADSLHRLPAESQAALIDYGVRTVIDLRQSQEIQDSPNPFFGSSEVKYYHQNLSGDVTLVQDGDPPDRADVAQRISEGYCRRLDRRHSLVREILATLAQPESLPALFHCAGGTDRTGIISALLLGIAGVTPEIIAEDYTLSARYLINLFLAEAESPDENLTWEACQQKYCPPEVMLLMLQHLEKRYGGVEGYSRTIGLMQDQIDSLRNALVE